MDLSSLKKVIQDLWSKYNVLFIVVGLFLLLSRFGYVIMELLAFSSKKEVEKADKKDEQLRKEEDSAKVESNKLVEEAKTLPSKELKIDEDWYKK